MPKKPKTRKREPKEASGSQARFPRHTPERALRIPKAIIEQNAGKDCTVQEAAQFTGVGFNGPFQVEISSCLKYGFLERPSQGRVSVTDRARQAIRPQKPGEEIEALRQAVLAAPDISNVYLHYRGENLPDPTFFEHALEDKFHIPRDKVGEFIAIFYSALKEAQLVEERDGKVRVLDTSNASERRELGTDVHDRGIATFKGKDETCFVVMPFGPPTGSYYSSVYEPAIKKAGLRPIRADADIFGTGKIIDQIWHGINNARVLVADLTGRNPNVFYELGLAHALSKPVVLVSRDEADVPFDLQHIRVIYYDVSDPFWGEKLIDKVAENILSAVTNPEEAIFKRALEN